MSLGWTPAKYTKLPPGLSEALFEVGGFEPLHLGFRHDNSGGIVIVGVAPDDGGFVTAHYEALKAAIADDAIRMAVVGEKCLRAFKRSTFRAT